MPRTDPDTLLTHAEAAAYLGITRKTLYAWNTRGTGPTRIRLGRSVQYRRSDLDHYIAAHEIPGSTPAAA